jgi:hypothetical protein
MRAREARDGIGAGCASRGIPGFNNESSLRFGVLSPSLRRSFFFSFFLSFDSPTAAETALPVAPLAAMLPMCGSCAHVI